MILYQLNEDDPEIIIDFPGVMTDFLCQNVNYVRSICFSDECIFLMEMEIL